MVTHATRNGCPSHAQSRRTLPAVYGYRAVLCVARRLALPPDTATPLPPPPSHLLAVARPVPTRAAAWVHPVPAADSDDSVPWLDASAATMTSPVLPVHAARPAPLTARTGAVFPHQSGIFNDSTHRFGLPA